LSEDEAMPELVLLTKREYVAGYVEIVQSAADSNKEALGFFRPSAYEDFARSGCLFVATIDGRYAGHVAFGGVFPRIKVWQLNVDPGFRGQGLGRRLFDALFRHAESNGYMSIQAAVASDLAANGVWEAFGLRVVRQRPGGASRNRIINIRERLIGGIDLLTPLVRDSERMGIGAVQLRSNANIGSFVVDVNVLLDALRRQGELHQAALDLLSAAQRGRVTIRLAHEGRVEIERNATRGVADPLAILAKAVPELPPLSKASVDRWAASLRPLVFPDKDPSVSLNPQEASDLSHLGAAIEMNQAGFITRDSAILRARHALLDRHELDVMTPSDLAAWLESEDLTSAFVPNIADADGDLSVRTIDQEDATSLRESIAARFARAAAELTAGFGRAGVLYLAAYRGTVPVALAWGPRLSSMVDVEWRFVFLGGWEDDWRIADHFLAHLQTQAGLRRVAVSLELYGANDTVVDHLKSRGCLSTPDGVGGSRGLVKPVVGGFVDAENWTGLRDWIKKAMGLQVLSAPETINSTSGKAECRTETEERRTIPWNWLETVTGPVLYLFRSGFGLIVPIQRVFAEELLGTRQGSMLDLQPARLRTVRAYFKSPKRLEVKLGAPILFRESMAQGEGSGAAIGCARLVINEVLDTEIAKEKYRKQGVMDLDRYERNDRDSKVGVVGFDNFQEFTHPVGFRELCDLEAVDGSNNVTTNKLPIHVIANVVRRGFRRD
jgi:ribosomal protein S18 acetylase RimI-like enzyme/predicted nucleic acid-binding protein